MDVLVLTSEREARSVLPALELLPHNVALCRPSVQAFLASDSADAVLIDGRTQPVSACELSRLVAAADRGAPVIGVIEESGACDISADCAVVQLIRSDASPAETEARLMLARRRHERSAAPGDVPGVLAVGPFEVDVDAYSITVDGAPLELTHHEFELLKTLLVHAGRLMTRTQVLAEGDGWSDETNPRAVDCHVRSIRAKLGRHRTAIRTVRGMGYVVPWMPPGVRPLTCVES